MANYITKTKRGAWVRNGKNKVCGEIEGDTLKKRVKFSKHYFYKFDGWSWDARILESAKKKKVQFVEINEIESGTKFRAVLSDFWKFGIPFDFGHSEQICLPLNFWEIVRK